jgi:serine/threonine protein phosphatase PrpC
MRQYKEWQRGTHEHQHYAGLALAAIGVFLMVDSILSGFMLPSWLLRLQAMPEISMSWTLYEGFLSFFALNLAIVFTISVLIWNLSQDAHRHKHRNISVLLASLTKPTKHFFSTTSSAPASEHKQVKAPSSAFPSFFFLPQYPQRPRRIQADTVSHTGIVRANRPNEDASLQMVATRQTPFRTTQSAGVFVVADGMGGHNNGQEASSTVVATVRALVEAHLHKPGINDEELRDHLVYAVQQANAQLFAENTQRSIVRGTTVTGVVLLEQPSLLPWGETSYIAHVINVGDSRTYLYSQTQGFSRVTRDHSIVELMIEKGLITQEERYTNKNRNQIFRCIGDTETVEIDVFTIPVQPGDRLLLCSDGLWEMVRDDEIAALLAQPCNDPARVTSQLLDAAIQNGGHDNITAVVIMPE